MSYQVLARKWRPKNFKELVGQDSARQTLMNALSQSRLYPVLIFTGPRGTGKTSTARIVAKSLRCQNKNPDLSPCEKCEDCLSISSGSHLDVIEIDGASNNGVEAVRELRDRVSYMPSTGEWKIYIIDEVHMLSNSAFNALLKTLEEPPKHVVFIMATTENQKIPATVLSRCQKIDFHLLSPLIIKKQLEKICKKEEFSLDENLLWLLARQAQGSLRDAQSLLDQVITFCGTKADEQEVRRLLGLSDVQILEDTLKALVLKDEVQMISLIAKLRHKNTNPKYFLESLLSGVSHLLFLKKNPENDPPLLPLSKEEIQRKKELLNLISYQDLHFLFDMLLKGEQEIRLSHDSTLVLEVLLLRICSAPQLEHIVPFSPKNHSHLQKNKREESDKKRGLVQTVEVHQEASEGEESDEKMQTGEVHQNASEREESGEKRGLVQTEEVHQKTSNEESSKLSLHQGQDFSSSEPKDLPKTSERVSSVEKRALVQEEEAYKKKPKEDSSKLTLQEEKKASFSKTEDLPKTLEEDSAFEDRFEFLEYLKKKDPILSSFIAHFSFERVSRFDFKVFISEDLDRLEKHLEEREIKQKLEQELSRFLDLKQKVRLVYQVKEKGEASLKEEKEHREQQELFKKAEDKNLTQDIKEIFKGKIRSVKKIDKKL